MRSTEDETLRVATREAKATLTALWEGGGFTVALPPGQSFVVGRGSQADVAIDHPSISRRHVILHVGESLSIEDLGSSNGTRVRARALRPAERVALRWGEPIEVGQIVVIVKPPASKTPPDDPQDAPSQNGTISIAETLRLVDLVAPTHISVLLLGETGVGKGHLAKRIHDRSRRSAGPWLHLNCAALPEHLLESELFGHERGAFTGANQTKVGLLEAATGGTVFLDEIGDLPASVQAKLLIALERGEVLRVGALRPQRFDVRFVAATNKLFEAGANSSFRADLYYRLAGMPILVPPLRERTDEIPSLARTLIAQSCERLQRPVPVVSDEALEALAEYEWPGNVRELASVLERALLLCGQTLHPQHLGLGRRAPASSITAPPPSQGLLEAKIPEAPPSRRSLAEEVGDIERRRIMEALEQCAGNQVRAAQLLGISRRTLISRMVSFGIPRPRKG